MIGGNYTKSEFSFAKYKITENKSVCIFGTNNSIMGNYYLIYNY